MPLPSLYRADDGFRAWRVTHAAAWGGLFGALAALLKKFGAIGLTGVLPSMTADPVGTLRDIGAAALGLAVLCAGAALLRNFLARHLVWGDDR